ncbi:glycerate kinase [Bacillaceae bacterium S4-13-58]
MKIVIAPDSFKESMTALEAAHSIERGLKKALPNAEYVKVPMADGGEGTVQSLVDATGGSLIYIEVTGPLGNKVDSFFGILGDGKTAVIEMAAASGLHQVPMNQRNPLITTTKGTGDLILAALDKGVEHIIIGIGGSATNDGGAGMAQALGVKLLDSEGNSVDYGGGELQRIEKIDLSELDPRVKDVKIEVACDVDNPLTGERGASAVFGPQKGATPEMVQTLDRNLKHYAAKIKEFVGMDIEYVEGAGAAGGLGAGLMAFLSAELKRGVDIVIDAVQLEKQVQGATFVITGEGRIDRQTIYGKTPIGVAKVAKKFDIPVFGVAGLLGEESEVVYDYGIDALFSIVPGAIPLEVAMEKAQEFTERQAENIGRLIKSL